MTEKSAALVHESSGCRCGHDHKTVDGYPIDMCMEYRCRCDGFTPVQPLADAVAFITYEVIGNEWDIELPASLRPLIAQQMVNDERIGWPDLETADAHLDDWEWTS